MNCSHNIFIRVDGDATIGLGHLVRCYALANMLKDDFDITFFCRSIPKHIENELCISGFRVILIAHENDFLAIVAKDNIVVLDGYNFDTKYQMAIKGKGINLVCIDDMHEIEFVADLIINHAPGVSPPQYKAQPYTQFALGPDYVLLRPSFLHQEIRPKQVDKNETILICFGGADPGGLTIRTLKVVLEFGHFKRIIIITGAAYLTPNEFGPILESDPRIIHMHNLNEEQMLSAMQETDIAVVPASGILYEALSTGCKVISGYTADNQKFMYERFRECGYFTDADNFTEIALNKALTEIQLNNKIVVGLIDGKSPKRIRNLIEQFSKEPLIIVRKAEMYDKKITFSWATNSAIRHYSFQQHQITYDEHSKWFIKKITDRACLYLLAELNTIPIGSIRFDISNGVASISYLVDPEFHGQGFGLILLKKGIICLLSSEVFEMKQIRVISGEVMKENIASLKAFERLGFDRVDHENYYKFTKCVRGNHLK